MNIALSILSAAASAEAAGTAEAYSGPWENVYNAVHSTAEAVTSMKIFMYPVISKWI